MQIFKKRLQHRCFPVNIENFLQTPILKKYLQKIAFIIGINIRSFGSVSVEFGTQNGSKCTKNIAKCLSS